MPDPNGPDPSSLGQATASASLYRVIIQSHFVLLVRLSVLQKRCPIWRLSSQAPPPAAQRHRPPTNEHSRGLHGAGLVKVWRAAGVPRHVHKAKRGPRDWALRLPKAGGVGDAGEVRQGRTTTPDRQPAQPPPVGLIPKPHGRCIFISFPLSARFKKET